MKKTLNKLILTSLIGAGSLGLIGKGYGQDKDIFRDSIEISIKSQNEDTIEQITWFSEKDRGPLPPHYAIFYLDKKENKYKIDCYKKLSEEGYLLLSAKPCSQIEEFFNEFYKLYGTSLSYPKKYRYIFISEGISFGREIHD